MPFNRSSKMLHVRAVLDAHSRKKFILMKLHPKIVINTENPLWKTSQASRDEKQSHS